MGLIEELVSNLTPGRAVMYLLGAFFLACLARKTQVQWQLSRLGARAPKVQFRLPYGPYRQPSRESCANGIQPWTLFASL